jgi:hypothetical protein
MPTSSLLSLSSLFGFAYVCLTSHATIPCSFPPRSIAGVLPRRRIRYQPLPVRAYAPSATKWDPRILVVASAGRLATG